MKVLQRGAVEIHAETDIVTARQTIRQAAAQLGFGVLDTTRIVTAASELARNIFKYAGKGVMHWQVLDHDQRSGLELCFKDEGPGIANVDDALREGFSSGGGLGMGLPGAKRLMDEMEVRSVLGQGTTVIVRKWRQGLNP